MNEEKEALILWRLNTFDCEDRRGYGYALKDILSKKEINAIYDFERYYDLDGLFYVNTFDTLEQFTDWYLMTKYLPRPNKFDLKLSDKWGYIGENLSYKQASYLQDECDRLSINCNIIKKD